MKNFGFAVLALVFVVCAVPAVKAVVGAAEAATPRTRAIEHVSPEKFYDLHVGPSGTCSIDFPALTPLQQGLKSPCAESATCPALGANGTSGAAIGDGCLASTSMGSDAGSFLPISFQLTCRAVTDGVVFKVCSDSTDGGAEDLGTAWFTGLVIKR